MLYYNKVIVFISAKSVSMLQIAHSEGLAIEPNAVDSEIETAITLLLHGKDPSFRIDVPAISIAIALSNKVPDVALARELARVAKRFVARTRARFVRLRFERIVGPGCKFFHVDHVECRSITTFAGPGTEFVPDRYVNRAALGKGDNDSVVPDPAHIRRLPLYATGYFAGVVHRSPPASCAAPRIVFVVDQLERLDVP
jgi:hypothetical protein